MKLVISKTGDFYLSDRALDIIFRETGIEYDKRGDVETKRELVKERGKRTLTIVTETIQRDDPALVKAVEVLKEEASTGWSDLVVVEIPDDVDYVIERDEFREWVAERHETWGYDD